VWFPGEGDEERRGSPGIQPTRGLTEHIFSCDRVLIHMGAIHEDLAMIPAGNKLTEHGLRGEGCNTLGVT
jgi:hypothetical protein